MTGANEAPATLLERLASIVLLVWAVAVAVLWFIVSLRSMEAGGGLADIPGGLAAIVAALTAGAGWNGYVQMKRSGG